MRWQMESGGAIAECDRGHGRSPKGDKNFFGKECKRHTYVADKLLRKKHIVPHGSEREKKDKG